MSKGVLARYGDWLDIDSGTPRISLGEGDTPLVASTQIGESLGLRSLHFKLEGCNPTGSFKDRGMVVAVARAMQAGSKAIICASTGNTSASAAAYGARFGLRVGVVIPGGKVAAGKLLQAQMHGATVVSIEGGFDAALAMVRELAESPEVTLVNSLNPYRIEGQKTGAFEIIEELGFAPDVLAIPVGNAGNITAYWRGFREYYQAGLSGQLPRMLGGQAAGAAPLVRGAIVEKPETVATAIRIGNPASWAGAIQARDASEGAIDMVSDEQILGAQTRLAQEEGIFCEPASAAALAVLEKAIEVGLVQRGERVVCVLTGNGLKDPEAAAGNLKAPVAGGNQVGRVAAALGIEWAG